VLLEDARGFVLGNTISDNGQANQAGSNNGLRLSGRPTFSFVDFVGDIAGDLDWT